MILKKSRSNIRRSEPGTRKYEWFLTEKGNKCLIIETYDSSNSGLAHVRGEAINKIFPEILKIANVTRFEICGSSNSITEMLKIVFDNVQEMSLFVPEKN
jgi:hypothetical protein